MDHNTDETKEPTSYFCLHCGAANTTTQGLCTVCKQPLALTSQTNDLTSGSRLIADRYQIIAELGSGGYSSVYKVYDTLESRTVALKQITLRNLSAQQIIEATDTFNRECQLLSHLRHPQLPQLFDYFNDNEHWYLVIEFMEGETLEQAMLHTPDGLSLVTVTEMGLQLCEVLDYLHHRQPPVIFRDLKPGNVMRTTQGQLSLVDFGIARYFKAGQAKDTLPLGSPGFASPEQYGRAQTTPRSDVYSLGALLHFLLTGKDPSENPFHFEPLRGYGTGLTAMNTLIQNMVARDPEQRPADMQEIKDALQEIKQLLSPPKIQDIHKATPSSNSYGPPLWTSGGQGQQQQQITVPPPHYTPPTKIWRNRNSSPSPNRYGGPIWPSQQPTPKQPDRTRRRLLIAGAGIGIALSAGWMYYKSQLPNMPPAPPPTQIPTEDITPPVVDEAYSSDYTSSPDFRYGARVSVDGNLKVDSLTEHVTVSSFSVEAVGWCSLYWSLDSTRIVVVDARTCQIWSVKSGHSIAACSTEAITVNSVAWSHDGQRIAICAADQLSICNTQTCAEITNQDFGTANLFDAAWSPDDAYLAFIKRGIEEGWMATIWDTKKHVETTQFTLAPTPSPQEKETSLLWSPGGQWLVFTTKYQIWRMQPGTSSSLSLLTTPPGDAEICATVWSPDGTQLALALYRSNDTSTIEIWNVAQKIKLKTLNVPHSGTPLALGWQADGKALHVLIDANIIDTIKVERS